jgi:short-subunit dehydrogenase
MPVDTNARVLITGASQGIGKSILLGLARSGHFVLGLSRTKPEELASSERSADSERLDWRQLDLSNAAGVAQCAASLGSMAVRALVLSAVDYGANERHPSAETCAEEWNRVIGTNCTGQCVLAACMLPKLTKNSPGIIVNVSSDVALLPGTGRAAYAASKAGLHAMLRAVAGENPVEHLRVYQLVPTFQLVTTGLRRRRPAGFDFSSYADPSIMAEIVEHIISTSGSSIEPGTYLVRRNGKLDFYPEPTQI